VDRARESMRKVWLAGHTPLYDLWPHVLPQLPRCGRAGLFGLPHATEAGPRGRGSPVAALAQDNSFLPSIVIAGKHEPAFCGVAAQKEEDGPDDPGHYSEPENRPGIRP
jgi:hypothetical protein